ncbi:MAG: hypothetical protein HY094_05835 [Candidatus Melainabacteria bacterium]|nr:hypothetical protein [Candidatus Melainabacteria bacterium]
MSSLKYSNLTPERKKKIEQYLVNIFKDVYYNNPNILKAKSESDLISDKIRNFILSFAESGQVVNEVDLLLKAKEKGQELVESHELVFFDEQIDKTLKMRAFLIPGMKVEFTEENAAEKVTEDDLQTIDHELCISFKVGDINEFTKLGNLLDIRATLAKALSSKAKEQKEVIGLIKENNTFKTALDYVLDSANRVLDKE